MRRVAVLTVGLPLVVPPGGIVLQSVAATYDRMTVRPPGDIIEVASARIHVFCNGPEDAPPVFLETGMGVVSEAWSRVHEDLAQDHRVCRYDWAGTRHSDAFDGEKAAGATADRLAALADAFGI